MIDRRDPFAEKPLGGGAAEDGESAPSATSAAEDSSACKIFVGNLPFDVEVATLEEIFGTFGTIIGVNIRHDRATGRPRGFGFVTYEADASAAAAIKALNERKYNLAGRVLTVSVATKRGVKARKAAAKEAAKQLAMAEWATVAPAKKAQPPNLKLAKMQPKTRKPKAKQKAAAICKNWKADGSCRFGDSCRFRHGSSGSGKGKGGSGKGGSGAASGAGKSWNEWAVLPSST
jgi:RNA recognition motif-containing protein|tara:strand:+ start:33 stop:728 length:696 start_codon:yes stop_codon:yes gene_type:complete